MPLPLAIPTRHRSGAVGLLLGVLILGMSCAGPAADRGGSSEDPARVYHVQVDMTKDKDAAHRALSKALTWWSEQSATSLPEPLSVPDRSGDSPATIVWRAPLYRVRLGPFASRAAAQKVLAAAQPSFPDAFIAPEQRRAATP